MDQGLVHRSEAIGLSHSGTRPDQDDIASLSSTPPSHMLTTLLDP